MTDDFVEVGCQHCGVRIVAESVEELEARWTELGWMHIDCASYVYDPVEPEPAARREGEWLADILERWFPTPVEQ